MTPSTVNPRTGSSLSDLTLRQAWRWWRGELAESVPVGLRPAARLLATATFLRICDGRARAWRYVAGQARILGELDIGEMPGSEQPAALKAWLAGLAPRAEETVLVLCPGQALLKTVELPAAAAENLGQVLSYELDRYTPFKADEVYFDYRQLRGGLGREELKVQFAIVPVALADPLLDLLDRAGVRPAVLAVGDDLRPEYLPLNLLPPQRRLGTGSRLGSLNALLAGLALALFAVALALPVWQKRQAVATLTPLVEQARLSAETADRLRQDLDREVQEYNFVLQRKHTHPAAVVVLNELTRVLANGTWLQQLDLRSHPDGWEVLMEGETTQSSKLVGIVDGSPLFRDSGYKSPLTKGQAPSSERFQLGALLKSAPPVEPVPLAEKQPPAASRPLSHDDAATAVDMLVPPSTASSL